MNSNFKILLDKEIIKILIGDTKLKSFTICEEKLMPYLSGPQLCKISTKFGIPEVYEYNSKNNPPKSRSIYMINMINHCIDKGTINKLLQFMFGKEQFNDLNKSNNISLMANEYNERIYKTIDEINKILYIKNYYLSYDGNSFKLKRNDENEKIEVQPLDINIKDIDYVKRKLEECSEELSHGRFDNVITYCRTILEEILIDILEREGTPAKDIPRGDILKQYKLVASLLNINTDITLDENINRISQSLFTIVNTIAELRNSQSSSHGVGSRREILNQEYTTLVFNVTKAILDFVMSKSSSITINPNEVNL